MMTAATGGTDAALRAFLPVLLVFVGAVLVPAPTFAAAPSTPESPDEAPAKPSHRQRALLTSPLLPTLALVANSAGLDAVAGNLRYHQMLTEDLGFTVTGAIGHINLLLRFYTVGVRVGPRATFSNRGVNGWFVHPNFLFAMGWSNIKGGGSTHWVPIVGAGVAGGYTFVWGPVALELGLGGYYSALLRSGGAVADVAAPPIKPELNISVGYAF